MTADPTRSGRSLRFCHYPAEEKPLFPAPRTNGYAPELAERLERDRNLTDGARRCARLLACYVHRRGRERLQAEITVTWLMKATGKCRRTVQRYLRQLERAGYIAVHVIPSARTRMSVGLLVSLLKPLLPGHRWPESRGNSGATGKSQNNRLKVQHPPIRREIWALRCMDGVFRSLMKTLPAPA